MNSPVIIGAGIAGLVAAIELEKQGYSPVILEATDSIGGRVRTDNLNGYPADHGFQVLLTAYPEAQRYLDYDQLDLINFLPGSIVFKNGKMNKIGDPMRDTSFLWSTLISRIGTLQDKLLILKLSLALKKKSIDTIFEEVEIPTLQYLKNYGFSNRIINSFFQPFFAGIYLEENLNTSSRMFEFVYKMFSSGSAAIPRRGMKAIPEQLASQLNSTTIRLRSKVLALEGKTITLSSGEILTADNIILATDPSPFFGKVRTKPHEWKSCYNLYFQSKKSIMNKPVIGLLPNRKLLVNNFHFLDDIHTKNGNESVLSVTVINDRELREETLINKVRVEMQNYCNIEAGELLRIHHIKKALPKVSNVKNMPTDTSAILTPGVFCCGDYLANSSLNAAMASGRVAASLVSKFHSPVHQ